VTRPAAGALALVESPAQLLNVVEAAFRIPDLAGLPIAVLAPTAGPTQHQLRAMAALAGEAGHELTWYEPRHGPVRVSRAVRTLAGQLRGVDHLVVGDPFSGVIQLVLSMARFQMVTVVDDGTATLEFARLWASEEPLSRWHRAGVPGAPRPLLTSVRDQMANGVRRRLSDGHLRMFTALPVKLPGVQVHRNDYAWVRSQWPAPEVKSAADLVGTSLVETEVVQPDQYQLGVQSLIERYQVDRYFAHRKESESKLRKIAALGVEVVRPDLPLELVARRGPIGRRVLSFPSTVVHTLPLVLAGTGVSVHICDIPREWYARRANGQANDFLGRVTSTARAEHGLAAVAC
jgi:hypothetical protein